MFLASVTHLYKAADDHINIRLCYLLINKGTPSKGTNDCELQKVVYEIIAPHMKKPLTL